MRIACLAWGSLVWDLGSLPIHRAWFEDGPFAPVEFTRQSSDGRITLVLDEESQPVRLLWSVMLPTDVPGAKEALRDREHITAHDWESRIGSWQRAQPTPELLPELPRWAETHGLDAAVWTALGPKFADEDVRPSADQVIEYLRGLLGTKRENAERYIRRTPRQIDTSYRRRIEAALGWTYWPCPPTAPKRWEV
jgi:hypothetical protein